MSNSNNASDLPDLDTLDFDAIIAAAPAPKHTWEERETMKTKINALVAQRSGLTTCPKCGGKGHIVDYAHINGGSCFACEGTGRHVSKRAAKLNDKLTAEINALRASMDLVVS